MRPKGLASMARPSKETGKPARNAHPHSSKPKVDSGNEITPLNGGSGTASIVVQKPGQAKPLYLLTCAHVIGTKKPLDNVVPDVYAPKEGTCTPEPIGSPEPDLMDTFVGELSEAVQKFWKIGDTLFSVDAGLIKLKPAARASNVIPQIGAIAAQPRDLIDEWHLDKAASLAGFGAERFMDLPPERQLVVQKYGRTTQLRKGKISRLIKDRAFDLHFPSAVDELGLMFEIRAAAGQKVVEDEYELDLAAFGPGETLDDVVARFEHTPCVVDKVGDHGIRIKRSFFSLPGDSGSPIVDEQKRLIGILIAGGQEELFIKGERPVRVETGNSQGVFIRAVLERLGVAYRAAGQNAAGDNLIVPGMTIATEPAPDFAQFQREAAILTRTVEGRRLTDLAARHAAEVRSLIHHNRRVMVTWHRTKGPGYIVALMRSTQAPLPAAIDGVSLADMLRAMQSVLAAEGSPSLRRTVEAEGGPLIVRLAGIASLAAFAERLETCEPVPA
ncbi:hypothetical protein [Mesorhizobium sp. CO1-1-8]|uniref:hypothetical protein n=1 Tax=Mesorhizobium sp. CO1-1-8 TaxID=2876631 RepID=UPI001CD18AD6|nr:hypothetical protein [Mesorhizobium sp. CO1-1-8]MBZ9772625.1 hypothetical protein [Mesorhizobium sp. CO1-1-8]